MRQVITDEFGHIKVDGQFLPGIFQGADIVGTLRVDEQDVPGKSGQSKQPMGFEDATITLRLLLPTDDNATCYERVQAIARLFRAVNNSAKPYVRRIINKHCAAWGISQVLFKELRTTEDNQRDSIMAELVFTEWQPAVVKKEQAVVGAHLAEFALSSPQAAATTPASPAVDNEVPPV